MRDDLIWNPKVASGERELVNARRRCLVGLTRERQMTLFVTANGCGLEAV
jgi:hypothetical protein